MIRSALVLSAVLSSGAAEAEDRHSSLRRNALSLPDVRREHLLPALEAAIAHETPEIPAELLVSIMWGESRFIPNKRTGRVCGLMQVSPADIGKPRRDCLVWERDVGAAVAAGVLELKIMLRDGRVRGDVRKALLYRACGNSAFDGTCQKKGWPGWVLDRAQRLTETSSR